MKLKKTPKDDQGPIDALYKEEFRKQAIAHGVADDCVIDKDTYAEVSCVSGCFKSGDKWIVYDTDERSTVYKEKEYLTAPFAYTDIASRLGFTYSVPAILSGHNIKAVKPKEELKLFDKSVAYDPAEAFVLVTMTSRAKFDETVELHVKLGVDGRHADQQVRGAVVLPHGTGKTRRVLVFCKDERIQEAIDAGADYAGGPDIVEKIQKENWFEFDVVIATPDMMGVVGRIGKILGPKGLMPSPKAGTVTTNIAQAVREVKAGKIEYRLDKTNIIHCPIGKVSFGAEKLTENYNTLMDAIIKAKPPAAKGQYIKSCVTASTMGYGIKVKAIKAK